MYTKVLAIVLDFYIFKYEVPKCIVHIDHTRAIQKQYFEIKRFSSMK